MAMRHLDLRGLALPLLMMAGCLPLAVPPATLQLGEAVRWDSAPTGTVVEAARQVRAGIAPLDLLNPRRHPIDATAGAFLDFADQHPTRGGYLDVGPFVVDTAVTPTLGLRLEPHVQGRVIYDPDVQAFGEGLAVQLSLEVVHFADGEFSTSDDTGGAFGYMIGETGVGIYLEGAYQSVQAERLWSFSGGLQIRIPAMLGFAYGIPH